MGYSTCQFGEDDLLHNRRQQADVPVSSLQHAVLLEAVEQQRLKPQHVLKIGTLSLWQRKKLDKLISELRPFQKEKMLK